jgi:hypothetical protein
MSHRFDGKVCPCGVRHRLHRHQQVSVPGVPRRKRSKEWTGAVKATPALRRFIRAAVQLARREGDCWVRTAHVIRAFEGAA